VSINRYSGFHLRAGWSYAFDAIESPDSRMAS
jgi:hypothetical protein